MFRKILIILLAVSAVASAKISLGVDMTYRVSNDKEEMSSSGETNQKRENTNNQLSVTPFLGIYPNGLIEISPFFGWHYSSSKYKSNYSGSTPTSKSSSSQHGIEPGCGLYFHIINNSNILDFSLGPKVSYRIYFTPDQESGGSDPVDYDKYFNGIFAIACQANIDLHFSERFAARMSSSLYRFSITNLETKMENSDVTTSRVSPVSDFKTIFSPSIGFYFTF